MDFNHYGETMVRDLIAGAVIIFVAGLVLGAALGVLLS